MPVTDQGNYATFHSTGKTVENSYEKILSDKKNKIFWLTKIISEKDIKKNSTTQYFIYIYIGITTVFI
jgi:hypothetical protein